ncbi:MAG TPA: ThiF family adenylyltransferase [Pirellulaceae bacterium]|nr:ThiF family adenylyltransferase [Pirellulaceae bacterium]
MSSDVLFIDDSDRYSRLRLIGWWDQDKIRAAKILVVGAGAIGNEVLKNLALLGVGHVYVIDLDEIEDSNLTRSVLFRHEDCGKSKAIAAAEEMRIINPDVTVTPIHGNVITDLGLGLFRDVDAVIGALDNREARLWVNRSCWKVGTPWIDGGIQEISGVAKVFVPPDGACYECAMTENDYRLINLRYSCPLLKREDLQAGKVPTAPTIASMIGGLQVQEALKLIHGLPVEDGTALVWNGQANNFYKTQYQRKEDCLSHDTYPDPIELPLTAAATADELFAAAAKHFATPTRSASVGAGTPTRSVSEGIPHLTLSLDRDLVVSLDCACGEKRRVLKPQQLVGAEDAKCPKCGQIAKPVLEHSIDAGTPLAKEKLSALGIPPYDIVRIGDDQQEQVFLLAGDRAAVAA